jgi:CHAT domain-containing protein
MDGAALGKLKAPDEEYLSIAVTRLLPQYYGTPEDSGAGKALRRMADEFGNRHRDAWLHDVLQTPHSKPAAEAFAALGRAASADAADGAVQAGPDALAAERLFQAIGNQAGVLRAQFESVYSLQLQAQFNECAVAAESLLHSTESRGYGWLFAEALSESGGCRQQSGDFERSAAMYAEATGAAKEFGYPVMSLRLLGFSAVRQRDVGNIAQAWRENARGLALYWSGDYPPIRAQQFYAELGLLAEGTNMANTAAAVSRENEEITSVLRLPERQAGALQSLAMSEVIAGFPERAMSHLREASKLASAFPTLEQRKSFALNTDLDMATLEAFLGEVDEPLKRLIAIEPQAEYAGGLAKLRFESELGSLRLKQKRYAESRALLESALSIGDGSRLSTSEDERPLWVRTMAKASRALVECDLGSGADPRHSWDLWERYRYELFDPKDPSGLRRPEVPQGNAVLTFVALPSGLAVWLLKGPELSFRKVDLPVKRISEVAERLTRGCATAESSEAVLRSEATALSQWLLGPLDKELNGVRKVIVETDDPVSAIPWPALVRSNGHYWTEDFALEVRVGTGASVESGPLGVSLEGALAVGAPAVAELPPLPEAKREAEKVKSLVPRSILLEGQSATLQDVRAHLASVPLFHFAGHGYGGEGGGLILRGPSGTAAMLRAADIEKLDLSRCVLAVLSGCSTGSGELHGPGDPQSLVRAFLRAGTHEVVASYWNISSAGTSQFMQEFYHAMLNRAPVAESLQKATAALRSGGVYAHPYYWAGLEVFQ